MDQKKRALILTLVAIPVIFILFLLAVTNVLFFLLGIIVILLLLLLLKRKRPDIWEYFIPSKRPINPDPKPPTRESSKNAEKEKWVYLVLSYRDADGDKRILVDKTVFRIGRADDCNYMMKNEKISRYQLRIEYVETEKVAYAIDPGSSNGNYINGEKMIKEQRYRLRQGDQLTVYNQPFVVDYASFG